MGAALNGTAFVRATLMRLAAVGLAVGFILVIPLSRWLLWVPVLIVAGFVGSAVLSFRLPYDDETGRYPEPWHRLLTGWGQAGLAAIVLVCAGSLGFLDRLPESFVPTLVFGAGAAAAIYALAKGREGESVADVADVEQAVAALATALDDHGMSEAWRLQCEHGLDSIRSAVAADADERERESQPRGRRG